MARGLGFIPELITAAASFTPIVMAVINDKKERKEIKRELRREYQAAQVAQAAGRPPAAGPNTQLAPIEGGLHSSLPTWFVPAAIAIVVVGGLAIYKLRK